MKHFVIVVNFHNRRYYYHVEADSQWRATKIFQENFPDLIIKSIRELINVQNGSN